VNNEIDVYNFSMYRKSPSSITGVSSNMLIKRLAQVSLTLYLCSALPCIASDEKREANIATDIQKTLKVGKAVWLQTPEKTFLGLYTNVPTPDRKGIIILLHDMGGNPDQEFVIQPLRQLLPTHQWASLSVQMPLRESGALMDDYVDLFPDAKQRLIAAVNFAKSQNAGKVIIAGYGLGALMATYALADQSIDVNGLILISLPVTDNSNPLPFIAKFNLPMLDVYAELDIPDVLNSANGRLVSGKKNTFFRQVKLENEGHQYSNDNALLLKLIYGWADRMIANVSLAGLPKPRDIIYKGAQGVAGIPGPKGDQGETGTKGEQGTEGIQGPRGDVGLKGEQGDQGLQGMKGEVGIQGVKGENGGNGEQGSKGDQGAQGTQGDQGLKGDTGAKGDQGTKGNQGQKGSKGDAGAKGEKGIKGDLGAKGDIGVKGDTGPSGDQGLKGETGIKGDVGPKGDTGAKGDRGIKGDTGPKGDNGSKGDQGIKGDTGPKGSIGPKGDRGIKGDTGTAGSN
jgi:pimeloyl-ACP methyl ester carboxylesterase